MADKKNKNLKSQQQDTKKVPIKQYARINPLKGLVFAALFAAFTAVIAPFKIPLGFTPVPITLQTIGVLLSGAVLGPVYGVVSMILYLAVGALGVPVFAGGASGIGVLFGYTGGYLISYPFAAFVIGWLANIKKSSLIKYLPFALIVVFMAVVYLDIFLGFGIMNLCDIQTKACRTVISQMTPFQYSLAGISLGVIIILALIGYAYSRKGLLSFNHVLAMFAGTLIIYIGGALQATLLTKLPWTAIFTGWVLPFLVGDAIKLLLAAYIAHGINLDKYLR